MGETTYYEEDQVDEFINGIGKLNARWGGDCKEYALDGMLSAIQDGPEYESPMFVFTDAPPKDGTKDNVESLLVLAESFGITINFFIEEACDKGDSGFKIYKELASGTGGCYLPIKQNELKRMANFTGTKLGKYLLNNISIQHKIKPKLALSKLRHFRFFSNSKIWWVGSKEKKKA